MTTSPLQFAKDFGKLKSDLASQPAVDLKLLLLIDFWPSLETHHDDKAYRSYFEEYIPLLLHLVSEENLHDLTLPELEGVLNTLRSVNNVMSPDDRAQAQDKIRLTTICLAKMLFYVGCVDEGVMLCAGLTGKASTNSIEYSDLDNLSELNALRVACDRFKDKRPSLYNIIKDVLDAWENERGTLSHERANCLFVEKGDQARSWRGRMRVLEGKVELLSKSAKTDQIAFENQIKSPDDPFIGVAYDSLEAARQVFKAKGFKDKAGVYYHAHFSIRDSTHTFTGDSIGLAVGLVTYTQLLKPEIMRQERFIASEVAFTGGVDEDGRLTPVNEETLGVKVERAFFSPVKYLVLPESNLIAAKQHLEKLKKRYNRRRLHLVPAECLSEVIENHNVIRAEKVCMGEFVVRKAYRYSRMTKVQVPLLAALLYLMICLLYTKAWIGFDRNPQYVRVTKSGFEVLNADSVSLWTKEYDCDSITSESKWEIGDLDGDESNEVAFAPMVPRNYPSENNASLFVYDDNGNLLFRRHCVILGEYPGDSSLDQFYTPEDIDFIKFRDSIIIISRATRSHPGRMHIKFWNARGDSLGWYINAGQSGADGPNFSSESGLGLLFLSYNNVTRSACLFALDPFSSFGASPPYTSQDYDLNNVKRGNQIKYVLFPPSDVNRVEHSPYNTPVELRIESQKTLLAKTQETLDKQCVLWYYLDNNMRVVDVKPNDYFVTKRNALVSEGKLPVADWGTYLENVRDSVTYWIDSGWVTEGDLKASQKAQK